MESHDSEFAEAGGYGRNHDHSQPAAAPGDDLAALREELAATNALISRMTDLLTGVAAGLKGDPPPLTMHDWSDLPALAAAMREKLYGPVGDDPMPVFVIKGKDRLAPAAVNSYRALCTLRDLHDQAEQVLLARDEIAAWQVRNPDQVKLPDHPHVPASDPIRSRS